MAFAAVKFEDFDMNYNGADGFTSVVSDTTSKAKTAKTDYARLYITKTTSPSKNCIFKTYYNGEYVSREYYDTTTTGRWMYYNTDIPEKARVILRARPDSSVPSCRLSGSFGAG